MTKDELMKYFSHRRYTEVREDIYRVMLEHPEITEPFPIEAAAEQISECRTNGVELSVENALRLTSGQKPPEMDELLRRLDEAGITNDNILDVIESSGSLVDDYDGWTPSPKAARQMEFLNKYADELAEENKDFVVVARPEFFRYADYAVLHLAVFAETLTKTEQNIIQVMRQLSSGVQMVLEENYIKLIFYIRDIWLEP